MGAEVGDAASTSSLICLSVSGKHVACGEAA
jgi:hypothetical protein